MVIILFNPRVLAYEKPVRFGRSLLAKGTGCYEHLVADGDKLHEPQGSFIEPRVSLLPVM